MEIRQFEKRCQVKHYQDLAGQAQADRRRSVVDRRGADKPEPLSPGRWAMVVGCAVLALAFMAADDIVTALGRVYGGASCDS